MNSNMSPRCGDGGGPQNEGGEVPESTPSRGEKVLLKLKVRAGLSFVVRSEFRVRTEFRSKLDKGRPVGFFPLLAGFVSSSLAFLCLS